MKTSQWLEAILVVAVHSTTVVGSVTTITETAIVTSFSTVTIPAVPSTATGKVAPVASNIANTIKTTTTASTTVAALPSTTIATAASSVSRAGGVLNPSAAAEANPVDTTAVKAFTGTTIKSSTGQCLTIDPSAGDFRENLIPITLTTCSGGDPGQAFDIVTSGKHNNVPGSILVVSSLTQGCLNFDPRRAAGDTVIMFSCGGRADGGGAVTNSQLFPFTAGTTQFALAPENGNGQTCLVDNAGKLDSAACTNGAEQLFTIG